MPERAPLVVLVARRPAVASQQQQVATATFEIPSNLRELIGDLIAFGLTAGRTDLVSFCHSYETSTSRTNSALVVPEDLSRLDSDDENSTTQDISTKSLAQHDDNVRRSRKFDVGPTVRYSVDAREVIMGNPK